MSKASDITHEIEPLDAGFRAIVRRDGDVIYSSDRAHGEAGIFPEEASAKAHARAWADAERDRPAFVDQVKAKRGAELAIRILGLNGAAEADEELEGRHKAAAKVAKENAAARRERIGTLAKAADAPRVSVIWDRSGPTAVRLTEDPSVWSEEFTPADVADPRQLALSGVSFSISSDGDDVTIAGGHGQFRVRVDGDEVRIVLGSDQIELVAQGPLRLVRKEEAEPKPRAPLEPSLGPLKDKPLRQRLEALHSAETLLGVLVLETRAKRPRARVVACLEDLAADHDDPRLMPDASAVQDGRAPSALTPDLAAAALVTYPARPGTDVLEQWVPECRDLLVLEWILDDEESAGESARAEVVEVVEARMAELKQPGALRAIEGGC